MFCPKCGNQISDGAAFCPNCGNKMTVSAPQNQPETQNQYQPQSQYQPQGQYQQQNQYQPQGQYQQQNQYQPQGQYRQQNQYQPQGQYQQQNPYQAQQPKKQVNKKVPIIIGIAAAVAVALILIFVVIKPFGGGNTGSPEGTIQKMESALNDLDFNTLIECCDSETREQIGDISSYTSAIDEVKSYIDTLGASMEFQLSGENFNYYEEDGTQYCSCDLTISYSISLLGQEQSDSETSTATFINENGQWLMTGGDVSGLFDSMGIF